MPEHVLDSDKDESHENNWSDDTVLDHAKHTRDRKIREALEVEKKILE